MGRGRPAKEETFAVTVTAAAVRCVLMTIVNMLITVAVVFCFQGGYGQEHSGIGEILWGKVGGNSPCIGFQKGRKDQGQDKA